MGKVFIGMAMSLDGFVAKHGISKAQPFGTGGAHVYDWLFSEATEIDQKITTDLMNATGAVVMGSTTYAISIEDAWGGANPFTSPVFVAANEVPDRVVDGFAFVTEGLERTLEKAKEIAGDKDIWIMGGASTARQYLKMGLVDELHLHVVPWLFGEGLSLFDKAGDESVKLEHLRAAITTPAAIHISYRVVR